MYDSTSSGAYTGANTAIGAVAGKAITTGVNNLCLGAGTGYNLTTGSNNILIGISTGGINSSVVPSGYLAASSASASNELRIGAGSVIPLSADLTTGAVTINSAFTLPAADGNTGEALTTDGAGNVSWTDVTFTGNTSGTCISDIWVTNVNSCSPLYINPQENGNVYIGSDAFMCESTADGKVGIGTQSPVSRLHVSGDTTFDGSLTATTGNDIYIQDIINATTLRTDADGRIISGPSDSKVKKNIVNIPTLMSPLEFVKNLRGVEFEWKDESRIGSGCEYGFVTDHLLQLTGSSATVASKLVKTSPTKFFHSGNSVRQTVNTLNYLDILP
jgi:hypothetical protein